MAVQILMEEAETVIPNLHTDPSICLGSRGKTAFSLTVSLESGKVNK